MTRPRSIYAKSLQSIFQFQPQFCYYYSYNVIKIDTFVFCIFFRISVIILDDNVDEES